MLNPLNTGASKAFRLYSEEQASYIERKHRHYNAWLMDNKRPFGEVYPGFPEDADLLQKLKENNEDSCML